MTGPDDDGFEILSLSDAEVEDVTAGLSSAPPPAPLPSPAPPSLTSLIPLRIFKPKRRSLYDSFGALLDDLTVPPQHLDMLRGLFKPTGYLLDEESVRDQNDATRLIKYTAAASAARKIAILHFPDWALEDSYSLGIMNQTIKNLYFLSGRILSENVDAPMLGYRKALKGISEECKNQWMFVPWRDIRDAVAGRTLIDGVFDLPPLQLPAVAAPAAPITLEQVHYKLIADTLANEAKFSEEYFDKIRLGADWPQQMKDNITFGSNRDKNAYLLLDFLLTRNRYDKTHKHRNDTYLGWMLLGLLPALGEPPQRDIATIIVDYSLINDPAELQAVKDRFI